MMSGKAADIRSLIEFGRQSKTKRYSSWIEEILDWAERNDMTLSPHTMVNPIDDHGDIPYFRIRLSDANGAFFVALFRGDKPGPAIAKARKERISAYARTLAPPAEDRAAA